MRTAKSGDFTTPGGVYPYQKGKKVTNAQLGHLLDYFAQHDNPSPTRRIEIANQLEMSAKAVGIWFQNERANVKKGRSRAAELLAEEAMHPIVFHSSHRPRPYIVTSSIPHHRSSHHYASPPSYGHTGRSDDAISVYSCESDDDSEATEDIETPLSELVMSRHLPEVRVQLAEGSSDRRDEQIDGEGLMVAKILVDMKFSKL
ncbi:hypothetical protein FRB96_009670 [Tulasnella sp. 330]|nr:hypothetical protein FRB96_009670 [Tulasnella sp. 330]KAG8883303.1 hypothetical protein FRB97_006867 [Tulasnella sp. 331]KAG8888685.1 hypothetical protein FRB98_007051 [Tulasnella sp. 332]